MSPLFLLVSLVAAAYGATALCLVRVRTNGEEAGFALTGAFGLLGGVVGLLVGVAWNYLPILREYCDEHLPWRLGVVVEGAALGCLIYIAWHAWELTWDAYRWARHAPAQETIGFWLRRHLWTAAAVAFVFAALLLTENLAGSKGGLYDILLWFVLLIAITSVPLYQTWVLPWLMYYRASTLDTTEYRTIHNWLDQIRQAHNVPKFHLRVQEGKMVNAMAIGGLRRYFIVLGSGLLHHLSADHVKAVLAHEIGHVLNRDTTRRTSVLMLFCAGLHILYFNHVVLDWESEWAKVMCVGFGAPIFWVILPGIFQRRWEYRADRKAVEIMGDTEVVAQSLERIYDVNNVHVDAPGWPHPSLRARLKAIRALDPQGTGAR